MDSKPVAMIVGGVVPAVLLGLSNLFQKLGTNAGIGPGPFLLIAGLTTAVVGGLIAAAERDTSVTPRGLACTVLFGIVWAAATGCIAVALKRLGGQISQLVPLYNMNTLVAVVLGLVVLSEWRTVSAPRVVTAAVLIIAGGVLASRS